MRVLIDARAVFGLSGGVAQAMIILASSLSKLSTDDEFIFMTSAGNDDWISNLFVGNVKGMPVDVISSETMPLRAKTFITKNKSYLRDPNVKKVRESRSMVDVPLSNGIIESVGPDLVHFSFQNAVLTNFKSIYCPHDIQHIYYPGYFQPAVHAKREVFYKLFSSNAEKIVVHSQATKTDMMDQYGFADSKIDVIPHTSYLQAIDEICEDDEGVLESYGLEPNNFIFYPANFWPHKNHIKILQAMKILYDRGIRPPKVVFTGPSKLVGVSKSVFNDLKKFAKKNGLENFISVTGFVSHEEILSLSKYASMYVIPSKFEGFGIPILDAFYVQIPVVAADASCLPEVAGDAALLFDPDNASELADAIFNLQRDKDLRGEYIARGNERLKSFESDIIVEKYLSTWKKAVSGK